MPKLLIFDAFTLLICEENVAIYALLRCKIFSLKIWDLGILDKFHVWYSPTEMQEWSSQNAIYQSIPLLKKWCSQIYTFVLKNM